jgi:osmotically-inducible protein OsmY
MNKLISRPIIVSLLLSATLLSACSAVQTFNKCGVSGCPGDAEITADVKALFEQHPDLGPVALFSIKSLDGVVYLSGKVDTDLQKQAAEDIAMTAPNVKRVVNSIYTNNAAI